MGLVKGKTTPSVKAQRPQSSAQLAAALEDVDAGVRRHAAREIVAYPDAGKVLSGRLRREEDRAVRQAILSTLIHLNDPSSVEELAKCLCSEEPALRNEVIDTLKEVSFDISPMLKSLLAAPDPDLRIFAVNILESRRHPDVERWLIEVIERDAHVNVCATALDLLCEVGTEAALEPLTMLKERFHQDAYIQFAAELALKRIREI